MFTHRGLGADDTEASVTLNNVSGHNEVIYKFLSYSPCRIWGSHPRSPGSHVTMPVSNYVPLQPQQPGGGGGELLPHPLALEQGSHKNEVELLCQ